MRSIILSVAVLLLAAGSARAEIMEPSAGLVTVHAHRDPWLVEWLPAPGPAPAARAVRFEPAQDESQPLHQAAIEHSDAYQTRAKIHKYASFATLPLFATELWLGQSLYNTPSNVRSLRAAHGAIGAGIVGLFGVNTVTGAWNLFGEGWSEKDGRTLRLVHGLLMMAADAGFLATTMSGPNSQGRHGALTFETDKVTHRNMAIASISLGTIGYLVMLIGNH
jgi:hypothetical protein